VYFIYFYSVVVVGYKKNNKKQTRICFNQFKLNQQIASNWIQDKNLQNFTTLTGKL